MNVRVKVQLAAVGMQNASHAGSATEELFISGQSSQSIRRRIKKTTEEYSLMAPCQFPQRCRNRERYQKVGNRQQLVLLPVEPYRGFVILATWAVPVSAGFRAPFKAPAVWALYNHFASIWRSTCKYCIDCLPLRRQKTVRVCLLEWLFVLQ